VPKKQSKSIKQIAEETNRSRSSVRKYLRGDEVPKYSKKNKSSSKLNPYTAERNPRHGVPREDQAFEEVF